MRCLAMASCLLNMAQDESTAEFACEERGIITARDKRNQKTGRKKKKKRKKMSIRFTLPSLPPHATIDPSRSLFYARDIEVKWSPPVAREHFVICATPNPKVPVFRALFPLLLVVASARSEINRSHASGCPLLGSFALHPLYEPRTMTVVADFLGKSVSF